MEALGSYPISFGSGRVPTTSDGDESKRRPNRRRAFQAAGDWLRRRSTASKIGLAVAAAVAAMFVLKHTVTNHNYLFIASETIHAAGLLILAYKLTTHKTCSGEFLSLSTFLYYIIIKYSFIFIFI